MARYMILQGDSGDWLIGGQKMALGDTARLLLRVMRLAANRPDPAARHHDGPVADTILHSIVAASRHDGNVDAAERIARAVDALVDLVGTDEFRAVDAPHPVAAETALLSATAALQAKRTGDAIRAINRCFHERDTARVTVTCRRLADALSELDLHIES
jgi:hypothetical protein